MEKNENKQNKFGQIKCDECGCYKSKNDYTDAELKRNYRMCITCFTLLDNLEKWRI